MYNKLGPICPSNIFSRVPLRQVNLVSFENRTNVDEKSLSHDVVDKKTTQKNSGAADAPLQLISYVSRRGNFAIQI
jgi:hypothetical protein